MKMQIDKIDVLLQPRKTWQAKIRMFPTLKIGDKILSGVLLKPAAIRKFVKNNIK